MTVRFCSEALKATASSTLSRLLRYNPGLLGILLDKFGVRHFVAGAVAALNSLRIAWLHDMSRYLEVPSQTMCT